MSKIVSLKEKKALLHLCLDVNIEYFHNLNVKNYKGLGIHYLDLVESLKEIKQTGDIKYKHAFFYLMGASAIYQKLIQRINERTLDISHIENPEFWNEPLKEDQLLEAVYFIYSFFSELYKERLKADFSKIDNMSSSEYLTFRSRVEKSLE